MSSTAACRSSEFAGIAVTDRPGSGSFSVVDANDRAEIAALVRAAQTGDHDAWLAEAINREPSPADSAAMADQIEALLRGLPDVYGQILGLRLEGHTAAEIAGELKLSRQTIYRALHVLQERLA